MTPETRREVLRMRARGARFEEIAEAVGYTSRTVMYVVEPLGGVIRPEMWKISQSRMSLEERVEIKIGLERDLSYRAIGRSIGRNPSTVCREVNANGGRRKYQPVSAHHRAFRQARPAQAHQTGGQPASSCQSEGRPQTSMVTTTDSQAPAR